jgi:predicted TIM-barrel fold metal-dependent hydrolase
MSKEANMKNTTELIRAATIPGPDPDTRQPRVSLPAGACDCHAHVFGPQQSFPYVADASFIPPDASPGDYIRMLRTIGCERAVLVQPSIYGTDNRCMLAGLSSGLFRFRGVAVIDERIGDDELHALHRAGVRGVRINVASKTKAVGLAQAPLLAERIKPLGWHLQFFVRISEAPSFEAAIARLPVPCVIDHFARVQAADGVRSPGFESLLRLARLEHVWFKLMGPYRISIEWPLHPDVAPLARELAAAAPNRCVWGTDWPHPNAARVPNAGDLADALAVWIPDAALRRRILVDNPVHLYDFE